MLKKKKKFYVNKFYDDALTHIYTEGYGDGLIGLFEECGTTGKGNFCGYYGAEYYVNTKLLAFYVADCRGVYSPEKMISDITICKRPVVYKEVSIGSHMWTKVIDAETVEEAIEKFKNADWRRWTSSEDEFTGRY